MTYTVLNTKHDLESLDLNNPCIELAHVGLSHDEGTSWILKDINLKIATGSRVALIGANGSGKTSLAHILAGLIVPDEGEVCYFGECARTQTGDISAHVYEDIHEHIGVIFQNPEDQIITRSVETDVAFGPENLRLSPREIRTRVDESLHTVAMDAYAFADPTQLSGGQQQRIAIAGALAVHPRVLIADEPSAMLDVRGQNSLMQLFKKLHAQGTTLVHITHSLEEALFADHIVVLQQGHIAAQGTPDQILRQKELLHACGCELPFEMRLKSILEAHCKKDAKTHTTDDFVVAARTCIHNQKVVDPNASKQDALSQEATALHSLGSSDSSRNSINTKPLFELDAVSYQFSANSKPALSDVSLSIFQGEWIALIGHTGSGKTTLTKLLAGLLHPSSGSICFKGSPLQDIQKAAFTGAIGYCMQKVERQLFAATVFDDVAYGPSNLGLSESEITQRTQDALRCLGIEDLASMSPFELSDGQMRRVALAGVLSMQPKVLLLDEPTAGLDGVAAYNLMELLKDLHSQGITIVMCTHNMEEAACANRICVFNEGHLLETGTPREVFSQEDKLTSLGLGVPEALTFSQKVNSYTAFPLCLTYSELVETLIRNKVRNLALQEVLHA